MKFVLIILGRHAVEMLLVAVESPGVIAVLFCLVPIGILHKRRHISVVLKVCLQECCFPVAARHNAERNLVSLSLKKKSITLSLKMYTLKQVLLIIIGLGWWWCIDHPTNTFNSLKVIQNYSIPIRPQSSFCLETSSEEMGEASSGYSFPS